MSTSGAHGERAGASGGGHTLLEVVLSTAVLSVVMGAMVSTMVIAGRAIDDNPVTHVAAAGDAVNDVTTDISLARSVTESTDNAVTLVVPDRDGDGQSETIRYSWSGTPGDPLMRQYNGSTAAVVATDVHRFNLSYLTTEIVDGSPAGSDGVGPGGESDEMELASHVDAPSGSFSDTNIGQGEACAEYFKPTLPGAATSWKINTVMLCLSRKGKDADGVVAVQIRTADSSHRPTATVLGQATVYESTLTDSLAWTRINLGPVTGLDPDLGHCIVVRYVSGKGDAVRVQYERNGKPMPANCDYLDYDRKKHVWKAPDDRKDLRFAVYGTVSTGGS